MCFNPLVIGSSVLITDTGEVINGSAFQSPSNRVKCSDYIRLRGWNSLVVRFNPLVIGSSVLITMISERVTAGLRRFNPLVIGSSVLISYIRGEVVMTVRFNPLVIGSSVLIHLDLLVRTL